VQFKEAHLDYLVHTKVTVQASPSPHAENPRFQRMKSLPPNMFHQVFGDCFISGFLSGGEFTALVSLKFLEGVDISTGSALAKVALTPLTGDAVADAPVISARGELVSRAEVSVNVNWSGGGNKIFEQAGARGEQWDISSVMRAAARFPEAVAGCPQRIAAVLTRYTTLRTFVEQMPGITPLDYDNTVLYSGDLLDAYMEYKHFVKQLNLSPPPSSPARSSQPPSDPVPAQCSKTPTLTPNLPSWTSHAKRLNPYNSSFRSSTTQRPTADSRCCA